MKARIQQLILSSGELWSCHYRSHGNYILDWKRAARFRISANGQEVHCRPYDGATSISVEILNGLVRSCARSLRGSESLHATALAPRNGFGAIAFLGLSGAGKSTLAAALIARGWRLLCDDTLPFLVRRHEVFVRAGASRLKLSDRNLVASPSRAVSQEYDPNLEKWVFTFPSIEGSLPLAGLFVLCRVKRGRERLTSLRGAKAAAIIQASFYNEILRPRHVLRRQMTEAARLAIRVPIWNLKYPTGFHHLSGVCALIEKRVRKFS